MYSIDMDSILRGIAEEVRAEILENRPPPWPPDSLFAYLRGLPPQTVGIKFATSLVRQILQREGLETDSGGRRLYSLVITSGSAAGVKIATKCSTEIPERRFQQVRDPRPPTEDDGWRYDCLLCIGVSPNHLTFWLLDAEQIADCIDRGLIIIQHTDSNTHWFFPSEERPDDPFATFIKSRRELIGEIQRLRPFS